MYTLQGHFEVIFIALELFLMYTEYYENILHKNY